MKSYYLLFVILIILITGCSKEATIITEDIQQANDSSNSTVSSSYLTETTYDGQNVINPELYQIPFKKTDFYISNKDLTQMLNSGDIYILQSRTTSFLDLIFNTGHREVISDKHAYEKQILSFLDENAIYTNGEKQMSANEYAQEISNWIIDSRASTEISVITDKSLVYADGYYYVRCQINISNYGNSTLSMNGFLPINHNAFSDEETLYCDVALKNVNNNFKELKIVSITILSQ